MVNLDILVEDKENDKSVRKVFQGISNFMLTFKTCYEADYVSKSKNEVLF